MPRRLLTALIVTTVLATACGADDTADVADPPVEAAAPTTPPAEPTTQPTASEVSAEPDQRAPDEPAEVDRDGPGAPPAGSPAHAIPILTEHVFGETVYSLTTVGQYLVVATGTGVIRVDIDTGAQVRADLPTPEYRRAEPFWIVGGTDHVLVAADLTREGAVELTASIDVASMEVSGRRIEPGGAGPTQAGIAGDIAILTVLDRGLVAVEPATVDDAAIDLGLDADVRVLNTGDEVWYLDDAGTGGIVDAATGVERTTFDTGVDTTFVFSDWEVVTEDELWIDDHLDATLHRLDRETLEVTTIVDLRERHPDAVVELLDGRPRDTLIELAVFQDGIQWLVLAEIDPTTGDVLWEHVFSQFGTSEGFSVAERGSFAVEIDGRIFVRDSARRIVEVDTTRLGSATGPWSSPELGTIGELDAEQQDVLETLRRFLSDPTSVAVDGSEALDEALGRGLPLATDMEQWPPRFVTIIDDRAFVRIAPVVDSDEIGAPFALRRTGAGWAIDGRLTCHVLSFTPQMSERCEA